MSDGLQLKINDGFYKNLGLENILGNLKRRLGKEYTIDNSVTAESVPHKRHHSRMESKTSEQASVTGADATRRSDHSKQNDVKPLIGTKGPHRSSKFQERRLSRAQLVAPEDCEKLCRENARTCCNSANARIFQRNTFTNKESTTPPVGSVPKAVPPMILPSPTGMQRELPVSINGMNDSVPIFTSFRDQECYIHRKCTRTCGEGVWKTNLSIHDRNSTLDLHVIGSLVYCKNSASFSDKSGCAASGPYSISGPPPLCVLLERFLLERFLCPVVIKLRQRAELAFSLKARGDELYKHAKTTERPIYGFKDRQLMAVECSKADISSSLLLCDKKHNYTSENIKAEPLSEVFQEETTVIKREWNTMSPETVVIKTEFPAPWCETHSQYILGD
uniref:(California timema) hypothetical protein n=1 Tax=Timema californicum TaxID=61474 RepID=A0A7R9JED7_TIMCA|nr:unnamed protein product [Timema californicum]